MKSIRLIQPRTLMACAAVSLLPLLNLTACQRRPVTEDSPAKPAAPSAETTTLETGRLGAAIDALAKTSNGENRSAVNLALAELDSEIAELQSLVLKAGGSDRAEASVKLDNLKRYRAEEMARLANLETATPFGSPPPDSRSGSQKLEDAAENAGDKLEEGAEKVGDAIQDAAHKTGEAVRDATH